MNLLSPCLRISVVICAVLCAAAVVLPVTPLLAYSRCGRNWHQIAIIRKPGGIGKAYYRCLNGRRWSEHIRWKVIRGVVEIRYR